MRQKLNREDLDDMSDDYLLREYNRLSSLAQEAQENADILMRELNRRCYEMHKPTPGDPMDKQAIERLIRDVSAGDFDALPGDARAPFFNAFMREAEDALPQNVMGCNDLAWNAYKGQRDAAAELQYALLPGWYCTGGEGPDDCWHAVAKGRPGNDLIAHQGRHPDNPARAWLLAILRALQSQTEGDET